MDLKNFGADERRNVNEWLQGRGNLLLWGSLILLGAACVWFLVEGLFQ